MNGEFRGQVANPNLHAALHNLSHFSVHHLHAVAFLNKAVSEENCREF